MYDEHITEADVESLADKLAAFLETLTSAERAAFGLVEQRMLEVAIVTAGDVEGYGLTDELPLATILSAFISPVASASSAGSLLSGAQHAASSAEPDTRAAAWPATKDADG